MRLIHLAIITLTLILYIDAFSRDRPIIDDSYGYKRILTDKGSLLRGVSLAFDGGDPYVEEKHELPNKRSFKKLGEEYGLNAVHVYLEGNSSTNPEPVGINLALADKLVELTKTYELYLIITMGCNGENGTIHSLDKVFDFWELYADRYKDETHVIFEAHNEPVPYTLNNFKRDDWDIQYQLYKHIRKLAPDSLILLGSFMSFFDPGGTPTWGSDYLEKKGVSWENAGFAFHGYWDLEQVEETIIEFCSDKDHPALLCTEFFPGDTRKHFNSMLESYSIGWLQFEWFSNDEHLESFREKVNQSKTLWKPDNPNAKWPCYGSIQLPTRNESYQIYSYADRSFLQSNKDYLTLESKNSYSSQRGKFFKIHTLKDGWVAIEDEYGQFLSANKYGRPVEFAPRTNDMNQRWMWLQISNSKFALRSGSKKTQHLLGKINQGTHKERFSTNLLHISDDGTGIFKLHSK